MFRCSDKKIRWYLNKRLAEPIPPRLYDPNHEEDAKAIRLLFEPKGTGRNRVGDEWYLENQTDKCVVCGREGILSSNDEGEGEEAENSSLMTNSRTGEDEGLGAGLTLHHVVPYQYRKEMPVSFKSHGSHDVLAVCVDDHERYERYADAEKAKLCDKYDAPLTGRGWIKYPGHSAIRAAGAALLRYTDDIPPRRIEELQHVIMKHYKLDTKTDITNDILEETLNLKSLEKGDGFEEHGKIVISAILREEGEDGFARFVRFWRQHFLDHMQPQYLSKNWNVNDPVNLVAGEYNPYRPEMDGS